MRLLMVAAVLALAGCATPSPASPTCDVAIEDRAWIDASLGAWRFSVNEITGVRNLRPFSAVLFDDDCVLTSADAFSAGDVADVTWRATPHTGQVVLPNGGKMPAGVTAFATAIEARTAFLVMSTPSVWRAAGVRNEGLGLEAMMTAVLLHEGAHIAQSSTYGARMLALAEANNLPQDFNDDSIQERFGENAAFAASVQRETELFFQASAAPDPEVALRLAREARELMRARQARWYMGVDAYLSEAEDVWLTFEGAGQWVGYQWLVHPAGGGAETDAAMVHFARRSRWWSQDEGLALAFALDRVADFDWKRQALDGGDRTLTAMLDEALAAESD